MLQQPHITGQLRQDGIADLGFVPRPFLLCVNFSYPEPGNHFGEYLLRPFTVDKQRNL